MDCENNVIPEAKTNAKRLYHEEMSLKAEVRTQYELRSTINREKILQRMQVHIKFMLIN